MTSAPSRERNSSNPTSFRGRLAGLSWAHFLNDGSANYLPGILPAVLVSLHEPVAMAGVLMGALLIGQTLQPLMGWIADRVGGRSLIAIGLLGSSVGGALLGLAGHLWMFIGLLLLIGLGNAMFHPQALASVRSLVTNQHGLNTSLFLVGGELGRGVWPTVASLVVEHFGLKGLWIFMIPALLTIPFVFMWAPKMPAKKTRGNPIHWSEHAVPLTMLVGYAGVRSFMTYGMVTFVPLLWSFRGGHLTSGASIITAMLVVGVIGNLGGGHLADRIGRRPVLLISVLASTLIIPMVVYSTSLFIWIFAAILGITLFLSASTTVLVGQDIFPENRSLGSGIALGFANGVGALLVFIIGFWVNASDIYTVFWVVSGAGIVSALFALGFPKHLSHNQA